MATNHIEINGRRIGLGYPTYIVAEMSANHNQDLRQALKIIEAARQSGADAIKLQTYTPDTMTINVNNKFFRIKGTIWEGKNLYDLYNEAFTPWEWHAELKNHANNLGLDFFSTPFDQSAVDFLEKLDVPAYKVASFELVDLPLIKRISTTGKPIIMSTGMATLGEIEEAVITARKSGVNELALLKCTSAYPASPLGMNLRTIPHLAAAFGLPVGLSDHTLGFDVSVAAVALGARIVEKHFTLTRENPGLDSPFSMEPQEFNEMVKAIRRTEKALGRICYDFKEQEKASRAFRRSLFVVEDMRAGEVFTSQNVRIIRPSFGLHPRYFEDVIGRRAWSDILKGTPLAWKLIS